MDRARMNRFWVNNVRPDKGTEMAAFLDIFHPDMPWDQRRELIRDLQ
jgi:hypothetical protein